MNLRLAWSKGNPLKLKSLKDCLDSDSARIALANPEAASVGKLTKNVLTQLNLWDPISKKSLVMKPTVNEVANSIKVDAADVGIVWDVIASQYDELDFVNLEELIQNSTRHSWIAWNHQITNPMQ